ncbi:MAG: cytochrome c-type biogenesis protein CcmH [Thiohalomonadales bacterium]
MLDNKTVARQEKMKLPGKSSRDLLVRLLVVMLTVVALLILSNATVFAKEATPMAEDPIMEKRVNEISSELRCLVCQNQTIADSHAELAVDLKNQVRTMVKEGKTQEDIVAYMVKRYGDFVLYRPPVKPETYILWAGPFILLIGGVILLMINLKKRRELIEDSPISDDEAGKLDNILNKDGASSAEEGKAL